MAGLLITANDVIAVLYGRQWSQAAPIFRLLCIAGFWQAIYDATGQVFISAGRTDRMFRAGFLTSIILVISFIVGLPWKGQGVAFAYSIAFSIILLPYLSYCYATIGFGLRDALSHLLAPLGAALAIIPGVWVLQESLPSDFIPLIRLIICIPAGILIYTIILSLISPRTITDFINLLKSIIFPAVIFKSTDAK
jgi:PST family polysaccharide transporter